MAGSTIIRFGIILAGAFFLFAALKPAFTGDSLNATFLLLGAVCIVLGVVIGRKSDGTPPTGA